MWIIAFEWNNTFFLKISDNNHKNMNIFTIFIILINKVMPYNRINNNSSKQ